MKELAPLARRLVVLGAIYLVAASVLVIYFQAPLRPVITGGLLVLLLTLIQELARKR